MLHVDNSMILYIYTKTLKQNSIEKILIIQVGNKLIPN